MTFHGSDIRQPVVIGRTPKDRLGVQLNLVDRPAFPCPECDTDGPMGVYVLAVRWPCGHTRSLPPLHLNPYVLRRLRIYPLKGVA